MSSFPGISLSLEDKVKKKITPGIGGVDHYVQHLKNLGEHSLKHIGKIIIKNINVQIDTSKEVNAISEKYKKQIRNYCDHVTETYGSIEHKYTRIIDSEFLFRNILEITCKFLYRAQRHLLERVAKKIYITKHKVDKIKRVVAIINKQYIEVKKGELKYICNKYEFCTPYPSFTDYMENFVNELLRLSDDKLTKFMYLLKNVLEKNYDFQIIAYRVQAKDMDIIKEAQNSCGERTIRECLSAVRAVLNQRFKIIVCPDKTLSVKIQAARILLNVVDKTFHHSNDIEDLSDYGTTINAIQTWNKNESSLPETVIELFMNKILKTITLSENSLKSALIEIIVTGEPDYDGLNKLWFVTGYGGVYVNMTKPIKENAQSYFGSFEYLSKFF